MLIADFYISRKTKLSREESKYFFTILKQDNLTLFELRSKAKTTGAKIDFFYLVHIPILVLSFFLHLLPSNFGVGEYVKLPR